MLRAHTKALQLVLLLATFTAHTTVAVCPGFDFAIGNLQRVGDGVTSCTRLQWYLLARAIVLTIFDL